MSVFQASYKHLRTSVLTFFSILLLSGVLVAQPDIATGKEYFKNQCAACHNKNMKDDLTGPALAGWEERWADYDREEIYLWIRNSQAMINDGHPKAVELWNQWKPTVMNSFPNITDDEIESIFLYIDDVVNKVPIAADAGPGAGAAGTSGSNKYLYWILFLVLIAVAFTLTSIIANLNKIIKSRETGEADTQTHSIWQTLTSKGVVSFIIFALVVLGGYTTVNNGIAFGRQQGYAPDQPINFSHATHAGIQGIDCQYCHDGARRSKHAVIPATNTCMNCHRAVKNGTSYGTAELTKIYASIGYNPSTDKYIENYDQLPEEEIEKIYTKWIGDEYLKDEGLPELGRKGERLVRDQWSGIKASLTNELKDKIQGPIEWTRIHHVPDHVYFNHQQHVGVGKLECQTCHGKVEEMEVMEQYAPLSMGWCINCHRETEVQFAGNEYYNAYENYHDALKSGDKTAVTVEDIGGLECQKCHY